MSAGPDRTGPLSSIRILDLANETASFCSKVLADLGARVVRAEIPEGTFPDGSVRSGTMTLNLKTACSIITTTPTS